MPREPFVTFPGYEPIAPEPEPETAAVLPEITWDQFRYKVGLRDDDPMSVYQDAQATFFREHVAPRLGGFDQAQPYFNDFLQRTARPQKYSPGAELFMQGATQIGKTALQTLGVLNVPATALTSSLAGLVSESDRERYLQAGRNVGEMITSLQDTLTSRQLEAQKRRAREVIPGVEEPVVHLVGDVIGSAPAFKMIGAIVPKWGSYSVERIGDVISVKPTYLTAAMRGGIHLGLYNTMVAEPGQKVSEGVHGLIAGATLGTVERIAQGAADRASAPFLNWLKWRSEPRTVRDVTPEAPARLEGRASTGTSSKQNQELQTIIDRMTPDEKVQVWQQYQNELGSLRVVPESVSVVDKTLAKANGGTIIQLANGTRVQIPYGAKGEEIDLIVKQILDSGQIATFIEGHSSGVRRYYGAVGRLFHPEGVTALDARNEAEALQAEEILRSLGLDARAEGKQVFLQPKAVKIVKGEEKAPTKVDVTTPLPPAPEPGFVERRKESRLVTSSEGVEKALGVSVQEALEKGYAKQVEGGWEFTREGWLYSVGKAGEVVPAAGPVEGLGTSLVEPAVTTAEIQPTVEEARGIEEAREAFRTAAEGVVPTAPTVEGVVTEAALPPMLEVGQTVPGYPNVEYQGEMLGLSQYRIKDIGANFSVLPGEDFATKLEQKLQDFRPKPGIVQRYELLKRQFDEGLVPKSQTTAVQATLRQLAQAIRTGLPEWQSVLEPEAPKPTPKVFGADPEQTRAISQTITVEGYNLTEQQKAQLAATQASRESQMRGLEAFGAGQAAERVEIIEAAKEFLSPQQQHFIELTESGVRVHRETEEGTLPEFEAMARPSTGEERLTTLPEEVWITGKVKRVQLPDGTIITYTREAELLPREVAGAHERLLGGMVEQIAIAPGEDIGTLLHEIGHVLHSQLPVMQSLVHGALEPPPGIDTFSDMLQLPGPTGEPLRTTWEHIVDGLQAKYPRLYYNRDSASEEVLVRLWTSVKRLHTPEGVKDFLEIVRLDDDLQHVIQLARESAAWANELATTGTSIDKLSYRLTQSYWDKWLQSYLAGVKARTDPSWTLQKYGELLLDSPLVRVGPDGRWMTVNEDGEFVVFDTFKDLLHEFDRQAETLRFVPDLTAALEQELKIHGWDNTDPLMEGPTTPPVSGIIGPSFMARRGLSRREFLTGKKPPKEPVDVGLTPVTAYFRNSRDWFNSVQQQTGLPVFDNIYLPFDSGQMRLENFLSREYQPLYDMLRRTTNEKRVAYRQWLMAKGVDAKTEVSHKNHFSAEDLENVRLLREMYDKLFTTFNIGDSAPFLEDYIPRMEQAEFHRRERNDARAAEADPFRQQSLPREVDFFAKHDRIREEAKEASTEIDAVLQLMQYMRIGAREQHLGSVWDQAKNTWRTLPPALREPVAKYMQTMYGEPDFVYQALSSWVDKWMKRLPGWKEMRIGQDALRKFVLLQYSSSLGFRPALAIRDGMQAFLTAYPHLGGRWFGHGFNRALTGDGWRLAERYQATIPDVVQPIPEAGEPIDIPGMLQNSLFFTQIGNNFGRVVTFNAAYDRGKLAIAQFRKDKNLDNFLQDSGAEILQEGLARDITTKALDPDLPVEEVSGLLGRYIVEATQWPIRKGNAPQLIRSKIGRVLGMYGQWPEQWVEYMIRGASRGSASHRAAWLTRWAGANGTVQLFFDTLGADVSRWIWTSPAEYNGSVWTTALQDLMRSQGQGVEASFARHRLTQLPLQFVPGFQQMRSVYNALDSDNPFLALLGFKMKDEPKFMAREQPKLVPGEGGFHSKLGAFLETIPEKISSQSLVSVLQSGVTSKNELEATGILKWLAAQPKSVSKKDVLDFFKENQISFREILKTQEGLANDVSRREYDEAQAQRIVTHDSIIDQLGRLGHGPFEEYNNLRDSMDMGQLDEHLADLQERTNASPEAIARLREDLVKMDQLTAVIDRIKRYSERGRTQYGGSSLNLPGGKDYREILMQLQKPQPTFEYTGSHWEEPNVLLHTRFDTVEREGEKTLRLQEIQSDWLQQGRESGFATPDVIADTKKKYLIERTGTVNNEFNREWGSDTPIGWGVFRATERATGQDVMNNFVAPDEEAAYEEAAKTWERNVPNAPYKETSDWLTLAAKKMLRYAVENGFKRISWTTAAQQSERYGQLVEQISVDATPRPFREHADRSWQGSASTYGHEVAIRLRMGNQGVHRLFTFDQLLDAVGDNRELADKIWNTPTGETVKLDKPIYQEGMEEAYDQMLVNIFRKLLGVKPEKKEAEELKGGFPTTHPSKTPLLRKMWEVTIPEAVEKKVKEEGVPIASSMQPTEGGVA